MRVPLVHRLLALGQSLLVLVLCLRHLGSDGREVVYGEVGFGLVSDVRGVDERHLCERFDVKTGRSLSAQFST